MSSSNNPNNNPSNTGNNANKPSTPMNIQPNQIAQLAQALKNEYALAKSAGTDVAARQQHLNRANGIRQILLNYQSQQKAARAAQQQQQGGQQAQGQLSQAPSQQAQQPIGQQLPQDISHQSPRIQNANINTPSAHSLGAGSPAIGQTPAPTQQSPNVMAGGATPAAQGQTPGPGQGQGQGSGTNNAVTVETYNQVKARLVDFQRKLQHLETTKRTYSLSAEQSANVESQIVELTKKFTTYKRYAAYMKTQLDEQARVSGQNAGAMGAGTGLGSTPSAGGSSNTSGSAQMNNIPTPAANQFQRTNSTQQSPQMTNQAMINTPNRGVPQSQQQQPQRPVQGVTPGAPRGPVAAAKPNQPFAQGTSASPAAGTPGSLVGIPDTTGAKPQPGRSVSPSGPAAATSSAGTPHKASTPGGSSGSNASSGPPPINLSGITKPSVPSIPISSTINVKPPTAVTLKPNSNNNRATLMGGTANGVGSILGTPALVKMPTYELAAGVGGETIPDNGGRVLTKRKLNELVNTIGADEGDGKTNIDGDVEEILLDLADEFINSVTGFACRLAKHRKVESVDVRDVQLHLERNWNIRIPGYAMDEIKTTRRWQPSSSYSQKLSGVDISKSVNGNIK
ncbi:transcription initiation factor TFIID subunit 12 [[Candida] railenensis]|uniref:TBP-associated factor 12 n=1 Tax=[Candida] railenensis TaxID=45579 RepID=A0A9P0QLC3_9ASCO|nr:transcription initiation factor TFIID subunit 12 [[Candida] railenensis]